MVDKNQPIHRYVLMFLFTIFLAFYFYFIFILSLFQSHLIIPKIPLQNYKPLTPTGQSGYIYMYEYVHASNLATHHRPTVPPTSQPGTEGLCKSTYCICLTIKWHWNSVRIGPLCIIIHMCIYRSSCVKVFSNCSFKLDIEVYH